MELNSFNKVWMFCPMIFKPEDASSRNTTAKVDDIRYVIRSWFREWLDPSTWVFEASA